MQDNNSGGQVIKPGETPVEHADTPPTQAVQEAEVAQDLPAQVADIEQPAPEPDKEITANPSSTQIEWTASEYIANPKSSGWFGLLMLGSVVLAAVVYVITRDFVSTGVIIFLAIIVGVFAARQPKTLTYKIDNTGVHIGERHFPYDTFKFFSIGYEHAIGFISLMPLRRFMPPLTIHYSPQDEERIAETLANYLPYEEHKLDAVDAITRRLRF